eukprot:11203748-Lingulodinium_polyedra.AAC.1
MPPFGPSREGRSRPMLVFVAQQGWPEPRRTEVPVAVEPQAGSRPRARCPAPQHVLISADA